MPVLLSEGRLKKGKAPLYGIYLGENEYRIYSWNGNFLIYQYENTFKEHKMILGNNVRKIIERILRNKTQVTIRESEFNKDFNSLANRYVTGAIRYIHEKDVYTTNEECFMFYGGYYFNVDVNFDKNIEYHNGIYRLSLYCRSGVNRVIVEFKRKEDLYMFLKNLNYEMENNKNETYINLINLGNIEHLMIKDFGIQMRIFLDGHLKLNVEIDNSPYHIGYM